MPELILLYHEFTTSINYDIDIDTKLYVLNRTRCMVYTL